MKFRYFKYYPFILVFICSLFFSCSGGGGVTPAYQYHTPEEIEIFLDEIQLNYPDIARVENVGLSESGRIIKALIISDYPGSQDEGEPSVRLTGGIHGNEMMGVELLIRFIEYLTSNYGKDSTVTDIVNTRYICIIPVLNPDGLARNRRYNDNNVDLNRNFNDAGNHWTLKYPLGNPLDDPNGSSAFSEVETQALRDFSLTKNFNLSITYHVGSVLVNMPFDYGKESEEVYPAENTLVKEYARAYTNAGTFLTNPDLYISPYMDEGTINGGDWYVITGSLQDWSYTETGCLDLTIEVAKSNPSTDEGVQQVFMYNRDSLIAYINKAGEGIYGRVTDTNTGDPIPEVEITVSWDNAGTPVTGDIIIKTDSNGHYNRILLPGTYDVTYSKSGYTAHYENNINISGRTELDIQLN